MISCITCDNIHLFGPAFHSQFRLRYRAFIERQDYDVRIYNGMEYDQYDTPASHYLVYHTEEGRALGVSRLTPTTQGCMLKDLWPGLVEDKALLQSEQVWEGTRYCIDKDVDPALRARIVHEMAAAYLEFGLEKGLTKIIGMMPTYIYRSVFEKPGIGMEYLGPVTMIGGHRIRAVAIPVDHAQLRNVRARTGIDEAVLTFGPAAREEGFPMAKPPDRELLLPIDREEKYDYERIQNIVAALEYLRTEAVNTGCEEIYTLVNSAFNMCFTLYYLFLRAGHIVANEN